MVNGTVRVLFKTRLIFPHINGPNGRLLFLRSPAFRFALPAEMFSKKVK